jgi:hypothetical protein
MTNEERRAGFPKARATNNRLAKEAREMLAALDEVADEIAEVAAAHAASFPIVSRVAALREQTRKNLQQIEDWNRQLDERDPAKWN